jgi:preprotein translocase subunit SecE
MALKKSDDTAKDAKDVAGEDASKGAKDAKSAKAAKAKSKKSRKKDGKTGTETSIYAKKKPKQKAAATSASKQTPARDASGKPKKVGIFTRIKNYLGEVRAEMRRVTWPTRQELVNASLIVVAALVFFGVYIAIIDNIVVIPLDWIAGLA